MFISVDLPAPFSPRRACTSPRRRSKSTPSFATTPGNLFVIDRSSRTGTSAIRDDSTTGSRGRSRRRRGAGSSPAPRRSTFVLLLRRRHDLAGRYQLLDLLHLLDDGGAVLQLRADLAVADTAVLDGEGLVKASLEAGRIRLELLRRQEHGVRDVLQCARQHELA